MDLKSLLNQALKSDLIKQGADALGKQSSNIKSSSRNSKISLTTLPSFPNLLMKKSISFLPSPIPTEKSFGFQLLKVSCM